VTVRVGVVGAAGRMGTALVKALRDVPNARLTAAVDRPDSPAIGKDAGTLAGLEPEGVLVTADLGASLRELDVVIVFSQLQGVATAVDVCAAAGVAVMIGTTGMDEATLARIDAAAQRVPVLVAANTSLAMNVLLDLVRRAASALPETFDIEVFEAHHRHKVDAPSGSALALGRAAADGRGERLPGSVDLTGSQAGPRATGGIGFSVARGGDVVGEHDVRFLGAGEQLRLSHVATDRAIFARGALAAALWLSTQPRGRYGMADFLFKK
jgi:4-hydroxy-tetrahydrodipicolinate reductase